MTEVDGIMDIKQGLIAMVTLKMEILKKIDSDPIGQGVEKRLMKSQAKENTL